LLAQPTLPVAAPALPSRAAALDDSALDDAAIAAALREQAGRARTHRYVWTAVNGALAVGSFVLLPVVDRESRPDFVVAGVGSLLSTVATFAFPLQVDSDRAELNAQGQLPPETHRRRLRELLQADAADERERLALPWHVVNLGVSALAGGIVAFGFHHTLSGITQGVGSFVLGEAQLFTQPTGLNDYGTSSAKLVLVPQISVQSRCVCFGLSGSW
jgi:hypothetical protein